MDEDRQRPESNDYTHAIREDHKRRNLLYAGTQHGIYYSYNDGDTWHSLSLNLPDVQISDIWVEDTDLVIATHGRSFYVLDDIGPLRQFSPQFASPRYGPVRTGGCDPVVPHGRRSSTWSRNRRSVTIDIVDPKGTVVRSFTNASAGGRGRRRLRRRCRGRGAGGGRGGAGGGGGGGGGGGAGIAMNPGFNTVTWDLRYPGDVIPRMILWGGGGRAAWRRRASTRSA